MSFDRSTRVWLVVVDGLADALVEAGHAVATGAAQVTSDKVEKESVDDSEQNKESATGWFRFQYFGWKTGCDHLANLLN